MAKVFVIDVAKCSGCYNCQLACKDEHAGNDWTPYAKPQPDIGQFWVKLTEHVNGTIVECNTAYEGARNYTDKHVKLIKKHGWSQLFNQIIKSKLFEEALFLCKLFSLSLEQNFTRVADCINCVTHTVN